MKTNKGLIVELYRSDYNCSLNLYEKNKSLTLVDKDIVELFEANEERPAIRIVKRFLGGRDYYHAEPIEPGFYAFGGAFVYTSDSRFKFDYPLPLHDRQMNLE